MHPIGRLYFSQRFDWLQGEIMPVLAHEVSSFRSKLEKLAHIPD